MTTYILRRILQAIPILFLLSVFLFGVVRLMPGGPLAQAERNPNVTPEQLAALRVRLGLDQPLPVQYVKWIRAFVLEGDWGYSIKFRRPVSEMIWERVPATLLLFSVGFLVMLLFAIPIGVYSAIKPYSFFDNLITTFSFAGQSVPVYWLGLILIVVFYLNIQNPFGNGPMFPAGGMYTIGREGEILDLLWHLALPIAAMSFSWIAWYSRFLRSSMRDTLNEDYIRTARAKGLSLRTVHFRHALRNALLPLVTLIALDLPTVFGGAVFIETIFAWPGMGRLFWDAAKGRDYPILLAVMMIYAALTLLFNLIADIVYGFLDPRIRYD
ncbi:MAG TPA: ABC transporter permease [Anaerolineales bacterium]|nr:ABC transporter permease [Anaerolineales bacterium]